MGSRSIRLGVGAIVTTVLAAVGCRDATSDVGRAFPLRAEAGRVLADVRVFEARLSGSERWMPCPQASDKRGDEAVRCDDVRVQPRVLTAAAALAARARSALSTSPGDARWTVAVIDLAIGSERSQLLDRAIGNLADVAARDSGNAAVLNDVAVAHLIVASARNDVASHFAALEAVERAAHTDTASTIIAFNRALILEQLHLFEEAEARWTALLKRDSDGEWSAEVRAHVAAVRAVRRAPRFADLAAPHVSRPTRIAPRWSELTLKDPQGAREYVLDVLVPAWGNAAQRNDGNQVRSTLVAMSTIGAALAASTGDSSVAHVARACEAAPDEVGTAAIDFGRGAASYKAGEFEIARSRLDRALLAFDAGRADPLGSWAELLRAGIDVYGGQYASADARYARIEATARRRQDHALQARALWGLALSAARQGRILESADRYAAAQQIFERIGERANEGSMHSQLADLLSVVGREDVALVASREALRALEERPAPLVRHGVLLALGRLLTDFEMPAAAGAVLREAVRAAPTTGRPKDLPEAMIRAAATEAAAGRQAAARAKLDSARSALESVSDSLMRDRLVMEGASTEATLLAASAPVVALTRLADVEAYYRRHRTLFALGGTLVRKAQVRLNAADTAGARHELTSAVAAIESLTVSAATPSDARALAAARRNVYRELVGLSVAHGDTAAAYAQAERARWPSAAAHRVDPLIDAGVVRLSYTVLRGETIMWISTSDGRRMVHVPAGMAALREMVERFEALIRRDSDPASQHALGRQLYALLVAPAAPELRRASEIELVTDGVIGRLPFAALRDESDRYLVEVVPIRHAGGGPPSTSMKGRAPPPARSSHALVVGDPTFDRAEFPELDLLRAAVQEAAEVGAIYPRRTVLLSGAATKRAVTRALPRVSVLHFAGHARLVPRRPEFSHLVLASERTGFEMSVLTADEIGRLDLRRLQLVVLSSCGTTQLRSRRDDATSGLSEAFLDAGAAAVISSLWEADDEGTAALMGELHRALAAGESGAEALRSAQRWAIRAGSRHRPPRVWSAFRYETH